MKAESIEKIIEYLNKQGIKTKYEYIEGELNRIIEFEIEGRIYFIEWWINQSYLKFINEFSVPNLPFKYIGVNHYLPTTKHKYQLCFYDEKAVDEIIENGIPFGAMKIPFNQPI
jgi:hypothetical protein